MIRIFLDANILFSAAWRESNGLIRLWENSNLCLVTSIYALTEAKRNLEVKRPDALPRLANLMNHVSIAATAPLLASDYGLPPKDLPILSSAVTSGCSVLLTGDIADFGHLMGKMIESVQVLTLNQFLQSLEI